MSENESTLMLTFVELPNNIIKCPFCDFQRSSNERKLIYNHTWKRHHIKISTKVSKTQEQIEEQQMRTRKLVCERVRKHRLLKQMKEQSDIVDSFKTERIFINNDIKNSNDMNDEIRSIDNLELFSSMDMNESLNENYSKNPIDGFVFTNNNSLANPQNSEYRYSSFNDICTINSITNHFNDSYSNNCVEIQDMKHSQADDCYETTNDHIQLFSEVSDMTIVIERTSCRSSASGLDIASVNGGGSVSHSSCSNSIVMPPPKKKSKNIIVRVINKIRKNLLLNNNNNNIISSSKSPNRSRGNSVNSTDMDLMQEDIIPTPNTSTKMSIASSLGSHNNNNNNNNHNNNNNNNTNSDLISVLRHNSSNSYLTSLFERFRS